MGDPHLIETWLELMRDMVAAYAREERKRIMALKYTTSDGCFDSLGIGDHSLKQQAAYTDVSGGSMNNTQPTTNLSLFRDSNRFSADSGIGNIWVMPKPDSDEIFESTTPPNTNIPIINISVLGNNTRTTWYMETE